MQIKTKASYYLTLLGTVFIKKTTGVGEEMEEKKFLSAVGRNKNFTAGETDGSKVGFH
jgi:hypothetical protein